MTDFKACLIPKSGTYSLQGYILQETSKALKFKIEQINGLPYTEDECLQTQWFPLSQTSSIYHSEGGEEMDNIVVSEWIMKAKEFI